MNVFTNKAFSRLNAEQRQAAIDEIRADVRNGRQFESDELSGFACEIRRAIIDELSALIMERLTPTATTAPTPEPEPLPTVEPAATYNLPTNKMRQALARFDDLSDSDQVDDLRSLWGKE